jgi:acyl-ACP thioesterase
MANKRRKQKVVRKEVRSGTPLTIYFSTEQAEVLQSVAQERQVAKATLVRYAVDQLLRQFRSGQLQLPLGL